MGVKASPAAAGRKTHKDGATSKLSKQQYITKPETRQLGTKASSAAAADSILKKVF